MLKTYYTVNILGKDYEAEIEFDYWVEVGQEEFVHAAPENCRPYYLPGADIELTAATIFWNDFAYDLRDSKHWDLIEESINENDRIIDLCFENEEYRFEGVA